MSSFDALSKSSILVADTGDFNILEKSRPQDATTNPSHILKVAKNPEFASLISEAIGYAKAQGGSRETMIDNAADKVCVNFGLEILKRIPGRVSSEVDARLSFNKEAMVQKAIKLINLYQANGVDKSRILVKIASTWEGIQAAKELTEKYQINCNLTLLFSMAQARACAEAGVKLISPFVGRANDWYKARGMEIFLKDEPTSPGVVFVKNIFDFYKGHGYKTEIMGASFRNVEQCYALAGCDLMTVWPAYLHEMQADSRPVPIILDAGKVAKSAAPAHLSEGEFRYQHNLDQMAVEQVSNGIRLFAVDSQALDDMLAAML